MQIGKVFGQDERKRKEGVWFPLPGGEDEEDAEILLLPFSAPSVRDLTMRLQERPPFSSIKRLRGSKKIELQEKLMRHVLAQGVIQDWRVITDDDGKNIPFTPQVAIGMMEEHPAFGDEVLIMSQEFEAFQADEQEDLEKNSSSTSEPKLTGVTKTRSGSEGSKKLAS